MKLLRVQAHNIQRCKDIDFNLEGHHLFCIGGKNGEGKTSSLTAIRWALCGKKKMENAPDPDTLLRQGEKEGWVILDLSGDEEMQDETGFKVELKLKRKPGGSVIDKIKLTDSTGEIANAPKETLQRLFNFNGFDPLAFERMTPKKQIEVYRELSGLDLTDLDDEHKEKYAERTNASRDLKTKESKFKGMKRDKDAPSELIDTKSLMQELDQIREHNRGRDGIDIEYSSTLRDIESVDENISEIKDKIAELKKQLEVKENEKKSLFSSSEKLKEQLDGFELKDESKISDQISNAAVLNEKFNQNLAYETAKQEFKEAEKVWKKLDDRIGSIAIERKERIENLEFSVEGMEYDSDGILLNGLPFTDASAAERTTASAKIGIALNPKLQLMIIEDGGRLDMDSLNALENLAKDKDYLFIVELVTRTTADEELCQVIIENGQIRGEEPEEDVDHETETLDEGKPNI